MASKMMLAFLALAVCVASAAAAGHIPLGSCDLNINGALQDNGEKTCAKCQWACLTNIYCTSMVWEGRTTGRATLRTYQCPGDVDFWLEESPGLCVLVLSDGTVYDTQEQGCQECTHQCQYELKCAAIYWNYELARKGEFDGFCPGSSPAPPVVPSPEAPAPVPSPEVLPPGPPVPSPNPTGCGGLVVVENGKQGMTITEIEVGSGNTINVYYNAFDIPDQFTVYAGKGTDGEVLFDILGGTVCRCFGPGCGAVAGANTVQVTLPPGVDFVTMAVNAPCPGTGYEWRVDCAITI